MTGIKKCVKVIVWIFKEDSYFAQGWENGTFLDPDMNKYKIFSKFVHYIFAKFYDMTMIFFKELHFGQFWVQN